MTVPTLNRYTIQVFRRYDGIMFTRDRINTAMFTSPILEHMGAFTVDADSRRMAHIIAKKRAKATHALKSLALRCTGRFESSSKRPDIQNVPVHHVDNDVLVQSPRLPGKATILKSRGLSTDRQALFDKGMVEFGPAFKRLGEAENFSNQAQSPMLTDSMPKAVHDEVAVGVDLAAPGSCDESVLVTSHFEGNKLVVESVTKLGPTQKKILSWLEETRTGQFNMTAVVEKLGLTKDSARKSLKRLVESGALSVDGDVYRYSRL